jgi:hypothetical protein
MTHDQAKTLVKIYNLDLAAGLWLLGSDFIPGRINETLSWNCVSPIMWLLSSVLVPTSGAYTYGSRCAV